MRGIRELTVSPNRKSFVVSGPNGSGKSGIVDAIQFALTGEMSRLSGKGTAGLSVTRHGPHVDRRDDPAAAEVSLRFYVPELDRSATLTRSVKSHKTFRLDPDEPKIRAVVDEIGGHAELTLSRREIIKYIIVEAGERSKEIQALLKLEEIGETRGVLKTMGNKLSITLRNAEALVATADDALRRHLDIKTLRSEDILTSVNPHRRTLGLALVSELTAQTDLSAGAAASAASVTFPRDSLIRDVKALDAVQTQLENLAEQEATSLVSDLDALENDPELLDALMRRAFVEQGLANVSDSQCPLCDVEWEDETKLRAHLAAKLARAQDAEALQSRLLSNGAGVAAAARRIAALVSPVISAAEMLELQSEAGRLHEWSADLAAFAGELQTVEGVRQHHQRLNSGWIRAPARLAQDIGVISAAFAATPDQGAANTAQLFLARAQDRVVACRSARREQQRAAAAVKTGNAIYKTYCDVADDHLSTLYRSVESEFAEFYSAVNTDDEGAFKARLAPAEGGLDLEVAFYDKGMFPPGAYHSEGHQDGMGVCLYLALMKRLLGSRFRFAVFDDVVMSVDHGHRKQFCRLLKQKFPDTQFIITTHDKVWAKQMHTEGLIEARGGVAFHSWSVQTGPIVQEPAGVWERIASDVVTGDIEVAAARLRRHLEFVAGELADELGATPRYRGDFSYDLGDLFPAVIARHGELLGKAAKAAASWNDKAVQARVEALKKARGDALAKHGGESWVVNKAVHYTEWAQFSKGELQDVVDAFRGVLQLLSCAEVQCGSWLYATPRKGDPDSLRCRCGAVNLNLRSK